MRLSKAGLGASSIPLAYNNAPAKETPIIIPPAPLERAFVFLDEGDKKKIKAQLAVLTVVWAAENGGVRPKTHTKHKKNKEKYNRMQISRSAVWGSTSGLEQ